MSQRRNNSATKTITVVLTIEGARVISITIRGSLSHKTITVSLNGPVSTQFRSHWSHKDTGALTIATRTLHTFPSPAHSTTVPKAAPATVVTPSLVHSALRQWAPFMSSSHKPNHISPCTLRSSITTAFLGSFFLVSSVRWKITSQIQWRWEFCS